MQVPARDDLWQEHDVVAHLAPVIGGSTPTATAFENDTYHLSFAVDPVFLFEGAIGTQGVRQAYSDADLSRLIRNSTFTVWVDPGTAHITAVDVVVDVQVTPEILGMGEAVAGERASLSYRRRIEVSGVNEPVSISVLAEAAQAARYPTSSDAAGFQGIGGAAPMPM